MSRDAGRYQAAVPERLTVGVSDLGRRVGMRRRRRISVAHPPVKVNLAAVGGVTDDWIHADGNCGSRVRTYACRDGSQTLAEPTRSPMADATPTSSS